MSGKIRKFLSGDLLNDMIDRSNDRQINSLVNDDTLTPKERGIKAANIENKSALKQSGLLLIGSAIMSYGLYSIINHTFEAGGHSRMADWYANSELSRAKENKDSQSQKIIEENEESK